MVYFIPDDELVKIPIKDNGERLVRIRDVCPKIVIRLGAYIKKSGKKIRDDASTVRETVAQKLSLAQSLLPEGYRLMIRCGHRPLSVQKRGFERFYNELKKKHPVWDSKKLRLEASRFIAPPDVVPPHSTGGTVDLSVIGPDGRQLKMGTRLGSFSEESATYSDSISLQAKKNRRLLIDVMTKAGFINYPLEWWHWSFGDRYWAAVLKKEYSVYDSI